MRKTTILFLFTLLPVILTAEVYEFFRQGDFNRQAIYGSGSRAFFFNRNTASQWNKEAGFMSFSLKNDQQPGLIYSFLRNSFREYNGVEFTVNVKLRGKGTVNFSFTGEYPGPEIVLTEQWENHTFSLQSKLGPVLLLMINMKPGTAFDMDNLSVSVINDALTIMPPTGALVVKPGSTVPEQTFRIFPNDARGKFLTYSSADKKSTRTPAVSCGGKAVFPSFTAGKEGYFRIAFATRGTAAFRDVVIAPDAEVDALENAAKQVNLNGKPLRILYLGDSLTDHDRGFNHPSVAAGVLDKFNPGMVFFRNAAIGGDETCKVANRLTNREIYCGARYDALWDEQYDIVFIMLGQNDTVTFSKTDFKKPHVSLADVEKYMRLIVQEVRKNTDAKIIISSGFSTPVSTSQSHRFGVPEFVEPYNACAKKIADEYGAEYLDLYSVFKAIPEEEKIKLFLADKTHLTQAGHRFTALQILKFLASKNDLLK